MLKCYVCNDPKIDHEVIVDGKFCCRPACMYKFMGKKEPVLWPPLFILALLVAVNVVLMLKFFGLIFG